MIANLLFDLDGTLTDPKDGIIRCIQFSLRRLGLGSPPGEDELLWCIGPPLRECFSRLLGACDGAVVEEAVRHFRERFSETGIYENSVYPGIVPALESIHAMGGRIFLATSKATLFARRILDHFGLTPFFQGIYGSQLDGRLADKADLVAHVMKTEDLTPRITLIVGDRFHDIVAGRKNGIRTAAVTYGYGALEEISASAPDFIFHSAADISAFFEAERGIKDGE